MNGSVGWGVAYACVIDSLHSTKATSVSVFVSVCVSVFVSVSVSCLSASLNRPQNETHVDIGEVASKDALGVNLICRPQPRRVVVAGGGKVEVERAELHVPHGIRVTPIAHDVCKRQQTPQPDCQKKTNQKRNARRGQGRWRWGKGASERGRQGE